MKYYIDTSLAIALANEKDPNHEMAIKMYPKDGKKVVSKLVLEELYSVYSRIMLIEKCKRSNVLSFTLLEIFTAKSITLSKSTSSISHLHILRV